ncbi:MAG: hypothetical protein P1U89_26000 [Verrucomicrobiales bacterium]|nr:hypothetical protein [Verrucomicrobiales bacterium]
MPAPTTKKFDPAIIIVIPLLGTIGGGYLSLPVTSLTRRKEPWTSTLLLLLLGVIIWLIGKHTMATSLDSIIWAWLSGIVFYLVMAMAGGFRQHIEPFFVAHVIAFLSLFTLANLKDKKEQNKTVVASGVSGCFIHFATARPFPA